MCPIEAAARGRAAQRGSHACVPRHPCPNRTQQTKRVWSGTEATAPQGGVPADGPPARARGCWLAPGLGCLYRRGRLPRRRRGGGGPRGACTPHCGDPRAAASIGIQRARSAWQIEAGRRQQRGRNRKQQPLGAAKASTGLWRLQGRRRPAGRGGAPRARPSREGAGRAARARRESSGCSGSGLGGEQAAGPQLPGALMGAGTAARRPRVRRRARSAWRRGRGRRTRAAPGGAESGLWGRCQPRIERGAASKHVRL